MLRIADLEMDRQARVVRRGQQRIVLTDREFALLEILMLDSPQPVSKSAIIERAWNGELPPETNVVNVFVNRLRNKISLPGSPRLIHTVRGVGFALRPPGE